MNRSRFALLVALVLTFPVLGGCVTARVEEIREGRTEMSGTDAIAVLGRRDRPSTNETEFDFVECVARNMGGTSGIPVVPDKVFRDTLFPWFEPRTAPVNTRDLPDLISHPAFVERLSGLGVKYIVWIEGSTRRTDSNGSMSCTASPAGAGCFGFLTWENNSQYEASIWDIHNGRAVGKVSSAAVGTSYMPALIVPVPIIARVKGSACSSLADQLKTFLTADS
ncbi:MAG: hypothetical protein H6993_12695 [Pseudomonadales bacterium]|nr:hypothetical protein [Pseudomonadales bacterium]MCP5184816.1 hypothetical protein [Pseudomonadales bacterium]